MSKTYPKENIEIKNQPFFHIDNSVRAQVYDDEFDLHKKYIPELLQRLLIEGHIIGNTSLNIAGDPMVFLPEDLYINCKRLDIKYILQEDCLYEVL